MNPPSTPYSDCLRVKHTAFKPVKGGNRAAGRVEDERKSLDDYLNLAQVHGFESDTVKLLSSTNESSSIEISGLIYGVFQAWKDEKSIAIAPHHIWFTIMCEVAKTIKEYPDCFRSIFTESDEKESIVLVTDRPDIVDPTKFVDLLREKIASPKLVDLVSKSFPTQVSGGVPFSEVMSTVLLEAASPFFNYYSTRCGIRQVCLEGSAQDWSELVTRLEDLKSLLGNIECVGRWRKSSLDEMLLDRAHTCAKDLRDRVLGGIKTDNKFVEECFVAKENCGSGHIYEAYGWIFDFYTQNVLYNCGNITYVSWHDIDTGRQFYQAYGLTNGRYDDQGVLRMSFGKWTYEVLSDELFQKIKG
jgi:hypothetical protein